MSDSGDFVIVIGSTYQQALLACEKAGIDPPGRGHSRTICVTSHDDIDRIRGLLPDRVIEALPEIGDDWRFRTDAVRDALNRLSRSAPERQLEQVWT